jgi:hypothetical protein
MIPSWLLSIILFILGLIAKVFFLPPERRGQILDTSGFWLSRTYWRVSLLWRRPLSYRGKCFLRYQGKVKPARSSPIRRNIFNVYLDKIAIKTLPERVDFYFRGKWQKMDIEYSQIDEEGNIAWFRGCLVEPD